MVRGRMKGDAKAITSGLVTAIKYGLKAVTGIKDSEEKPYELEFENDVLTDSCIDDLMNTEISSELQLVCVKQLQAMTEKITDDEGNPVEGIKFVGMEKSTPEKK